MAGTWTSERFPQFEAALRRLTDEHRALVDEPLHLAIAYHPTRDQQDIFLFEVIGSAGAGLSADRDLFETTFTASAGFAMAPDQKLHLILTNPGELETALAEQWPLALEVLNALRSAGDHHVLYADEIGQRLLGRLQATAHRPARAVHG